MKKVFLVLLAIVSIVITCNAQSVDEFCMPNLKSAEDAAVYVGQKVMVLSRSVKDPKYKDTQKYDNYFNGVLDRELTIKKIKFGSQIVFHLVTDTGWKIKVPVNLDGAVNYSGLSSCNIFFLVDDIFNVSII